jgi:hypothetical protein
MTRPVRSTPADDRFDWEAEDEALQATCPAYATGDDGACAGRCATRCEGSAALMAYACAFDAAARVSREFAEAAHAARVLAAVVRTAHHRADPPEVANLAAYLAERSPQ